MTAVETDNKAALLAYIEGLGLGYTAVFVPQSQSRNKGKEPCLNWTVQITKGRQSLTADYMQGIGHLPNYSHAFSRLAVYDDAIRSACETGKSRIVKHKNGYDAAQADSFYAPQRKIPAPSLVDVLYSLVMDSNALDYPTFDAWAGDMGYDTDSREAERIYKACVEIALKLRAMVGDGPLSELRELFQGY